MLFLHNISQLGNCHERHLLGTLNPELIPEANACLCVDTVNEGTASFMEYKCINASFPEMSGQALFQRATSPDGKPTRDSPASVVLSQIENIQFENTGTVTAYLLEQALSSPNMLKLLPVHL